MLKRSVMAVLAIAVSATSTAKSPEVPKQILHAWLAPTCPISPDDGAPRFAPVFGALLGWGVDYVIDLFGKALADAAQKDRDGLAISTIVPSYLYLYDPPHADMLSDGKSKVLMPVPGEPSPMQCLIVARASSAPTNWCGSGSPFAAESSVCKSDGLLAGVGTVSRGAAFEKASFQAAPANWPANDVASVPSFYAEVALRPSTDRTGVLPILRTLYYPGAITGRKFENSDPRDLVISASAATPKGDGALSTFALHLKKISPDPRIRKDLHHDPLPWSALAAVPDKIVLPKTPSGLFAVNAKVEVREIGDANPLLQAAAAIFATAKPDIAKDVKTLTPSRARSGNGERSIEIRYAGEHSA